MPAGKEAVGLQVPSKDPEKDKKAGEENQKNKEKDLLDEVALPAEELSEEDRELKEKLETAVTRLGEKDVAVHKLALETLRVEIRTSTSSMTSVPKPLKFLRSHYEGLKEVYGRWSAVENKKLLADILAVLAMTMAPENSRESLKFKLQGNVTELGDWGHEFVRSLAGEVGQEYQARATADAAQKGKDVEISDLLVVVDAIVPFHIRHNAEPEAVDILIEVQKLEKLLDSPDIDENNYQRICLYLLGCADYMSDPDDLHALLNTAFQLYRRVKQFPEAVRVALRMDDVEKISLLFNECGDDITKKQMAYILAKHRSCFEYPEDDDINNLISNNWLSDTYLHLARDLDVLEPKTPEDIYKSHLSETASTARSRESSQHIDSAKHNLASTFVNAFVNAGYGTDKLITTENNNWLYKHKDSGMLSAAASLGLIMLWNVEEGLTQIDKYLYSNDENTKAGAVLAVGIVGSGVRNECDPAMAFLSDHINNPNSLTRCAASLGLGLAYAGTAREDVLELLSPIVSNTEANASMVEVSLSALSLGLVFVGTCNEDVASVLIQRLMESKPEELNMSIARFLALGLGLLFLGKQEKADGMLEALKIIDHKIASYARITLETCAYAATGNVLKVQEMLRVCADHLEEDAAAHQQVAVIGIALTVMGEGIGTDMAVRAFDHLLQYGELPVRRAVPLALALMSTSNPDYGAVDTLSRLTHDNDLEVAQCAILGLGLCSAGTNNSRVAGLLRQLAEYYSREASALFVIRIAQGLLHMGKGLISINPFHSDRLLLSKVALGGILTVIHAGLDMKQTLLDKYPYLLFSLVCSMSPRMLITVDEQLKPLPTTVRVGQAVETVGQAGRPKTITGFQTHTTPVLLNQRERAELGTEEYLPCSPVLEGMIIVKKNPEFVPETK